MRVPIYKVIAMEITIVLIGVIALATAKNAFAEVEIPSSSITTGIQFMDGQSETTNLDDIQTRLVPVSLTHKKDRFTFGISFSHLAIEGHGIEEQGLGDTKLSIGYDINSAFKVSLIEKIATGDDERYLSTGRNDTAVQVDFSSPMMNPKNAIFAKVGYNFVGKRSDFDLQNSSYLSIGTGYLIQDRTKIGVSLDYRQSIFSDLDDQLGLSAHIDKPLNDTYNLSAFAGYDNTQTSTIGVTLTGKF